MLPRREPTPFLAYSIRFFQAAAGVMITASHNPAADNGYKVYLSDGAQIVPPADTDIEAAIAALGPLAGIAVAPLDSPLISWHGEDAHSALPGRDHRRARARAGQRGLASVRLHAAARRRRAARAAGIRAGRLRGAGRGRRSVRARSGLPDGAFPNPEEPGALDLAIAQARRSGADLVIANDPDGDRLAVAIPDAERARRLTGSSPATRLARCSAPSCSAGWPPIPARDVAAAGRQHGGLRHRCWRRSRPRQARSTRRR